MKRTDKVKRNPFVLVVASIIWISGAAVVVVAVTDSAALGWWAVPLVAGGFSSMGFATASLVTGKPEWILLDLILPG